VVDRLNNKKSDIKKGAFYTIYW